MQDMNTEAICNYLQNAISNAERMLALETSSSQYWSGQRDALQAFLTHINDSKK